MYYLNRRYHYYNIISHRDDVREILCGCAIYSLCGCDDAEDDALYQQLIGDGDYHRLDRALVDVTPVNGTTKILINGTLPNDTTGGNEDTVDNSPRDEKSATMAMVQTIGLWPTVAAVAAVVFIIQLLSARFHLYRSYTIL